MKLSRSARHKTHEQGRSKNFAVFVSLGALAVIFTAGIYAASLWHTSNMVSLPEDMATGPTEQTSTISSTTANPTWLDIPSLQISAGIISVGLTKHQTLEVPTTGHEVGWFIHRAKPGDQGSAILTGHLNTAHGPAVFYKLKDISEGDLIIVRRADGTTVQYMVSSKNVYPQNNFPSESVYNQHDQATLKIITCAGSYDKKLNRYTHNLVIVATLVL